MQGANAVGEGAFVLLWRVHSADGSFALAVDIRHRTKRGRVCGATCALSQFRRIGCEHGHDGRTWTFERRRQARYFGGNVVDALAQERILDAFGCPCRFRVPLDGCEFLLKLGALSDRLGKLRLKLRNIGAEFVGSSAAAAARRCEFVAQVGFGLARRVDVAGQFGNLIVALGQNAALIAKTRFQLLDAAIQNLGFRGLDEKLAFQIASASAEVAKIGRAPRSNAPRSCWRLRAHAAGDARYPSRCGRSRRH